MEPKRVVVTGLGALTPIGNTVAEYWEGLRSGISGAAAITHFDASKFRTQFACEIKGVKPADRLDRKEIRRNDLFTQYALMVVEEALDDAALDLSKEDLTRIGVIWGAGIGGLNTFQEEVGAFYTGDGTPRFNPFFIPKMIVDLSAGIISIKYGFKGPNFSTVSACASANNAIVDALNYIRLGHADMFVTGGSEAAVTIAGIGGFNAMKALSERNDDPKTASRPYDADRDGFVLGEGGACLILEELEHAKARGATIYAEVLGGGMSADAYHMTQPHPDGEGIVRVMQNALRDAGIAPEEIDYVNVHGTSTPLGDIGEVNAVKQVFGAHAYQLNISSTKSMTGHLLGAAGAVEAAACLLALQHQTVPPTINNFTPDEKLDAQLNCTFNQAQERPLTTVMSNGFGFGGHNCSVIFRKMD